MEISVLTRPPLLLAENGIMLAEACISLPHAEGDNRASRAVNRFYESIGDAIETIAREVLLPASRDLYDRSDDPRRRFTHRPFRLLCESTLRHEGDGLAITRVITVRHRGRVVFQRKDRELVCRDGLILPRKEKSPK